MKRSEKEKIVADVAELAGRAQGMFFTDFSGLTVEQATELRREFRKSGVMYRVVKNTLIQKALGQAGNYDKVYTALVGPTGIAFAYEDPIAPARIIHRFSEKHNKLSLKICVLEKQVYEGSKLRELARMPSRTEMIGSIVGSIQAPLAGVPTILQSILRDLVSVVAEIEKKKAA